MKNIIRKILKEETSRYLRQDHPLIVTIKEILGNEYEDTFVDSWDEETYEYKFTFDIPKILMEKVTDSENDNIWKGKIYVKVIELKISDSYGNVEISDIDNIPDYSRVDFAVYLSDTVKKWFPKTEWGVSIIS